MGNCQPPATFSVSLKCELNVNISILQVVIIEEKTPDLYWIKESWIMDDQVGSIYSRGEMELSPILHIFVLEVSPHWVPKHFGSNNHFQLGSHIWQGSNGSINLRAVSGPINFQRFWRTNHLRLRTPYILYLPKYQTPSSGTAVYTSIYNRNIRNPQNKKHPPNFFAQNKGNSVLRMEGT